MNPQKFLCFALVLLKFEVLYVDACKHLTIYYEQIFKAIGSLSNIYLKNLSLGLKSCFWIHGSLLLSWSLTKLPTITTIKLTTTITYKSNQSSLAIKSLKKSLVCPQKKMSNVNS